MNAEVRVGSINVGVTAELVKPTLITAIKVSVDATVSHTHRVVSTVVSINGHSLNAVNPDLQLTGGKATLVTA